MGLGWIVSRGLCKAADAVHRPGLIAKPWLPWLAAVLAMLVPGAAAAGQLTVCHGYSCYFKTRLELGAADLGRIASIMRSGAASPAAERQAVSRAVQFYEQRATALIGVRDRPKGDMVSAHERGQMDCVDESRNTTALLQMMASRGMFRYHQVLRRTSRGFLADGRYPHFTAVLADPAGQKWVVDSWYEPGGGPPDIMPLERWRVRGVGGRR